MTAVLQPVVLCPTFDVDVVNEQLNLTGEVQLESGGCVSTATRKEAVS